MSRKLIHGSLKAEQGVVAVVMAGGSGTRFWPLSRRSRPKQYLPLAGDTSLIQATVGRLDRLCGEEGVLIVTAENQIDLVRSQVPTARILAEPLARNTAACVGYGALYVQQTVGDVPMLCLPADHVIHGEVGIRKVFDSAIRLANEQDVLVTIGIRPTAPETGYGYIHCGEANKATTDSSAAVSEDSLLPHYPVSSFVEKPNRSTAQQYLLSGEYFWNSGMFAWRPSVVLSAIDKYVPALGAALKELAPLLSAADSSEEIARLYEQLESVSVDVGVMEQADNVLMIPGEGFMWSDVGSWSSWVDTVGADDMGEGGNITKGDVVLTNCKDCAVVGNNRMVAGVGLENVVVVDTDDALLVCNKSSAQDVKQIVDLLKKSGREDLL
jgi:mannose-1-phosphate guanylyltransferase